MQMESFEIPKREDPAAAGMRQKVQVRESNPDWTPFRTLEKKFKTQYPPPDVSKVLDLACLDPARAAEVQSSSWKGKADAFDYIDISGGNSTRKAYTFPDIPGFVLLPNFISEAKQKDLVQWSLSSHSRHPNPTNLDIHYKIPTEGLWNTFLNSPDKLIYPIEVESLDPEAVYEEQSGPRKLIDNDPASSTNFDALRSVPKLQASPSPYAKPTPCSKLIRKLRWANIGWFYHWGTKQYDFSKGKAPIDQDLQQVCEQAVACVEWQKVFQDTATSSWGEAGAEWKNWKDTYEPDAGIVNFYQYKDTLMGHVDRSEICATSPLVSISLGNAAIFLIGGSTRDIEPKPILLRSGDVVIMSGPICRRAYHGVPRILEGTLPAHLRSSTREVDSWHSYADFMTTTRVNINVRQVFPKGFEPPTAAP